MSQNIFEIWDSLGRITPFAVRRDNWSEDFYTVVETVECTKMPYGKAFGYPTVNGKYSNHYEYDSKWRKEKIIPCCGCYQWTLVEGADLTSYQEGLKATQSFVKGAYSINSTLYFKKHQGKLLEEAFIEDPTYIQWAINTIDNFFLTKEAMDYLHTLLPDFKFTEATLALNEQKLTKAQK